MDTAGRNQPEPSRAMPAEPGAPSDLASAAPRSDTTANIVLLLLSLGVVAAACVLTSPNGNHVLVPGLGPLPELCYSRRWLGIECPGCGLTRSFISIMHGQFARAWRFNPAGFLMFGLVAAQIPYRAWQLARLQRGIAPYDGVWLAWSWLPVGAALLIQWLSRF